MKTEIARCVLALVLAATVFCAFAVAEEAEPSASEKWEFAVTPYLWAASVEADIQVLGLTKGIDIDFGDILDNLEVAGFLAFEARKGRWALFLDGQYVALGDDGVRRGIRFVADLDTATVEFGGAYRLGEPELSFELLGGGRYVYTRTRIDITGGPSFSQTDDWVEPFVGGRLRADLSEKWFVSLRGDVGSFGIESDISWTATGYFGYRLSRSAAVGIGYRAFGTETEEGALELDTKQHGPIAGVSFQF